MPDRAGQPILRTVDSLLQRLQIDPVAYRALVHSFALMDLRNQQFGRSTATGPKARIAPLFWVLGQNLTVGLILSFVMFARVDRFFFTLVGLSSSMLIVASAVIVEFREIVLDPLDLTVLGHRPVPGRTYAAARITNLFGYLLICSCSAGLFPAIIGAGLRDAGWWQVPAYVWGALIGDFFAAGILILVFISLQQQAPSNSLQDSTAWLQVGLILVLFYGGQIVLRDASQPLTWVSYQLPAIVSCVPVSWIAQGICVSGEGQTAGLPVLFIGSVLTIGIWWFSLGRLSTLYESLQPGRPAWTPQTSPALVRAGELNGWLGRSITAPGEERVAFWLTWTMLTRDSNLRMRCWPSLAIVIALFAVGALTGQLDNPMSAPASRSVLALAAVYLIGEAVPALLHQLRFSGQFEASWILAVSPISDHAAFSRGICKAIWCRFVVPIVVLATLLFAWNWRDPLAVILHSVIVGLSGWGFLCGCSIIQLRSVPFTSPLAKGESFGPIAGLTAAMTAIAMTLAALHAAAVGRPAWFGFYLVAVLIVVGTTQFVAFRRLPTGGLAQ